ncbi:LysR family transcriptional regulator [Paraburkholderia lycopersici]|uniref:DNA-binding transcriptional regulator, LysR family n=1 Tax=Paraburkholderia lycopersici TaxID=416944 RepID=A0A1G6QX23_9BURK|nr:LysR family transcriptional regulator [Paraburkholderia lycopersici]SDC96910.1 DNA-binding transcriptional regulator, LysR family [Paraburkholderia lycopersici]
MDTLQNMRIFTLVAEQRSFTATARALNLTTGAISRAVSELESRLSIRLFNRSTRVVTLTPSGERYRHHALRILAAMDEAEREARNSQELAAGELRVTMSEEISHLRIFEGIRKYRNRHPAVSIALTLTNGIPDLYRGEADIALINATSLPDSEQVARHLTTTFNVLCAAPGYLKGKRLPLRPDDLANHECLALDMVGCHSREWTLDDGNERFQMRASSMLQTNCASILLNATLNGMGIGALPLSTAVQGLQRGELIHVLPGYRVNVTNVYAMLASRRFIDAKVRTWLEFMVTYLRTVVEADKTALAQNASPEQVGLCA